MLEDKLPPELKKNWVAKPIYEEKMYQFLEELMKDTILLKQAEMDVTLLQKPALPRNIAPLPEGNKHEIIAMHMYRFNKSLKCNKHDNWVSLREQIHFHFTGKYECRSLAIRNPSCDNNMNTGFV